MPLKAFALHDVQGLYGGHAMWAAEDRTAIVQLVGPPPRGHSGLWERRYRTKLTAEQWAEVERLVGAYCLPSTRTVDRSGMPDEGRPIIVVVPRAGAAVRVSKWANDRHPDFDPVYAYLLDLCRATGELVREGAFEWEWRPMPFGLANHAIRDPRYPR
ncbi:MAG: hypothetical protein U0736_19495 [Gemmataceae bacterium]